MPAHLSAPKPDQLSGTHVCPDTFVAVMASGFRHEMNCPRSFVSAFDCDHSGPVVPDGALVEACLWDYDALVCLGDPLSRNAEVACPLDDPLLDDMVGVYVYADWGVQELTKRLVNWFDPLAAELQIAHLLRPVDTTTEPLWRLWRSPDYQSFRCCNSRHTVGSCREGDLLELAEWMTGWEKPRRRVDG